MYGMWFIDYRPYFEIAKRHMELGNWSCAVDAMRISEARGEVAQSDRDYDKYIDLREKLQAK